MHFVVSDVKHYLLDLIHLFISFSRLNGPILRLYWISAQLKCAALDGRVEAVDQIPSAVATWEEPAKALEYLMLAE